MARKKIKLHTGNWDSTFQLMSWWKSETVKEAKVMVVGAGALGNEVLKNLALMNVGNILIVDFDIVEYSNLSRSVLFREEDVGKKRQKAEVAAERIREINPRVKVMTIKGDIGIDVGLGIFRRMDVIIGCLDNRLARLYINRNCFKVGKTWIDGAIENLAGQLNVYRSGVACYECELGVSEWVNIRAKMGCPDIARRYSALGRIPTTPISSSIIGAMQVQEAIKIIHGNEKNSMAGESFYYQGMTNTIIQSKSRELQEDCLSHYRYVEEELITSPQLSTQSTLEETFAWLSDFFGTKDIYLELDHELILEVSGEEEKTHELVIAKPHLSDQVARTLIPNLESDLVITKSIQNIRQDFSDKSLKLSQIGIPPLHILNVWIEGKSHLVELGGDESFLTFS